MTTTRASRLVGMTRRIKLFDDFHGILSSVSQALGNKRGIFVFCFVYSAMMLKPTEEVALCVCALSMRELAIARQSKTKRRCRRK